MIGGEAASLFGSVGQPSASGAVLAALNAFAGDSLGLTWLRWPSAWRYG